MLRPQRVRLSMNRPGQPGQVLMAFHRDLLVDEADAVQRLEADRSDGVAGRFGVASPFWVAGGAMLLLTITVSGLLGRVVNTAPPGAPR